MENELLPVLDASYRQIVTEPPYKDRSKYRFTNRDFYSTVLIMTYDRLYYPQKRLFRRFSLKSTWEANAKSANEILNELAEEFLNDEVPYELQSIGLTIDFFNEVCISESFCFPEPYTVLEEFATMLKKLDHISSINFIEQLAD